MICVFNPVKSLKIFKSSPRFTMLTIRSFSARLAFQGLIFLESFEGVASITRGPVEVQYLLNAGGELQ